MLENLWYVGSTVVHVGDLYLYVVLMDNHPSSLDLNGVGSRNCSGSTDREAGSTTVPLCVVIGV